MKDALMRALAWLIFAALMGSMLWLVWPVGGM